MMSGGADTDVPSGTWARAIAECEDRLVAADSRLRNGEPAVVEPFAAPAVEGTIPPALVERARACADRGEALLAQLAEEQERIRRELRRLPRMPPATPENRFDAQA
jgi:hypothetical protein